MNELERQELKTVVQEALKETLLPLENRLDGIEKRLGKVETRLDGVENRLDTVEAKLEQVPTRTEVREMVDTVDDRLMALAQGQWREIEKRFAALDARLETLDARTNSILLRLNGVDTAIADLRTEFRRLRDFSVEQNEQRRSEVTNGLQQFEARITAVEDVLHG